MKKSLKVLILSSFLVLGVGCNTPSNSGSNESGGNNSVNSNEVAGEFEETANATFTQIKRALATEDILSAKVSVSQDELLSQNYVDPSNAENNYSYSVGSKLGVEFVGNFDIADIKSFMTTGLISETERNEYYLKMTQEQTIDDTSITAVNELYYNDFVGYTSMTQTGAEYQQFKSTFNETAKNGMYTSFSQVVAVMDQIAALNTLDDVVDLVSTMVPADAAGIVEMIGANLIPVMKYLSGDDSVAYADISEFVENIFLSSVLSSSGTQEITPEIQEQIDKMLAFVQILLEGVHSLKLTSFCTITKTASEYNFSINFDTLEVALKAYGEILKTQVQAIVSLEEYNAFLEGYNVEILPVIEMLGDMEASLGIATDANIITGMSYDVVIDTSIGSPQGATMNVVNSMSNQMSFAIGTSSVVVPTIEGYLSFPENN